MDDPGQCNICADARDVIGGSFSEYFSGEKGTFIFDIGDLDQFIVVDLGQTRVLYQVGAAFSDGTSDREVFDYVEISTSVDGTTFVRQGIVGFKGIGDPLDFTLVSPVIFDISPPEEVQFVRYNFGQHSPDHGGGSRVFEVFAQAVP